MVQGPKLWGFFVSAKTRIPSLRPQRSAYPVKARRSSLEVDTPRARALLGDPLVKLTDADREWIWRSLLKGIRLGEACALAGLTVDQLDPVLASICHAYHRRIHDYKLRSSSP
jgi:hypothetical protein